MRIGRRRFVIESGCLAVAGSLGPWWRADTWATAVEQPTAAVTGHPQSVAVGEQVLHHGGNAVDAVVAAAFMAGVVALPSTGIGGYGGVAIVGGLPDGRVSAIDFNGTAPIAMRENQYEAMGAEGNAARMTGWTSVGVPGVLAGLQKLLDLHGTWPLARVMEPAIQAANDGFKITASMSKQIETHAKQLSRDPGSRKLFVPHNAAPPAGATFRNPELGKLLELLARDGNVDAFYRGRFAEQIVQQCQANGGWLAIEDMHGYQARVVEPLQLYWGDATVYTLPPTSGGMTVLQILNSLQALDWPNGVPPERRDIALVESMRLAWHDRLKRLGDPQFMYIPKKEMLSRQSADLAAQKVRASLMQGKPLEGASDGLSAGGTIHLNAVDATGLSVALTFTHGDGFGSHATVDGLGLLLGHGLSRFDPEPGRANSPASGKRPLHNMCPTLVARDKRIALTIGATGGRRIVNAVANVLAHYLGGQMPIQTAVKVPRLHSEGGLDLIAEADSTAIDSLRRFGFVVNQGSVANLTAIGRNADGTLST